MQKEREPLPRIACCMRKKTLAQLNSRVEQGGILWELIEAPDIQQILNAAKTEIPDCLIYEVGRASIPEKDLALLCEVPQQQYVPVVFLTNHPACGAVRSQVKAAACKNMYVMSLEDEELLAALGAIVRSHRVEEELRSANRRLVEVVQDRANAMQDTEDRYQFILDSCSDAVLVIHVDKFGENGVLVEANDVAGRWFGYNRDATPVLSLKQMFAFGQSNNGELMIEAILKQSDLFFETLIQKADGSKVPVEVVTRTVVLEDGTFRVMVLARRPSGTVLPQDESDMNEDYRLLASHTGLMMYDGNLKTQQMIWGGAVSEITGFSSRQLVRSGMKGWRERIYPEDYARVITQVNNAINSLGRYEVEYRIINKSGEIRCVEDHGAVLPDELGNAIRLLGTVKDVTSRVEAQKNRQRLESELQHSQRLESLGVLAGGIAHDFNNILAGIIGLTDLALREVPVDSFVHEDLTEVLQAANRAKELVRQILAFSRQSGQERNPIFLHIIAREVIKLLRASLPPTIDIIDSADVHSGAVMANAAQMHQVITNFSTNAAQAMKGKEGTIEIRVTDVFLNADEVRSFPGIQPGPYVHLFVMDSGHGMAESVLARVFDPFFTTKGPGEGTGMGLAVVHGIITDHGGVVTAESKLGVGSRFDVYLPRIAGVKVEEEAPQEKILGGNERVLFIDDDLAVLKFAESALPRLGFRLTLRMNGEEGLTTFLENPDAFDLVITDQVMPKMSGMEVARAIHAHAPGVPIILFTGFSDEILPETQSDSGIVEVVFKPIIIKELVAAMRRAVESSVVKELAE